MLVLELLLQLLLLLQLTERLLLLVLTGCAHRLVLRIEQRGVLVRRVLGVLLLHRHVVWLGLQVDHLLLLLWSLAAPVDLLQAGLFEGLVL